VAFRRGYVRGYAIHGNFAIVGVSQPTHNKTFSGLPLDEKLFQKNAEPHCRLLVIDLKSEDIVHSLRMEGWYWNYPMWNSLPGVPRPMAIGFLSNEIRRMVTMG
jgi:hypothetical protein